MFLFLLLLVLGWGEAYEGHQTVGKCTSMVQLAFRQ